MSFLIYHQPWQPGRMVLRLPMAMRMVDKLVAYHAAMTANDAIHKMMLDSK